MKIEICKKYKLADGTPVLVEFGGGQSKAAPGSEKNPHVGCCGRVLFYTVDGKAQTSCYANLVEVNEWEDFKIDEPVMVRNLESGVWEKRHFAGSILKGKPLTWANGSTSFTSYEDKVAWNYCRRPTEGELENELLRDVEGKPA